MGVPKQRLWCIVPNIAVYLMFYGNSYYYIRKQVFYHLRTGGCFLHKDYFKVKRKKSAHVEFELTMVPPVECAVEWSGLIDACRLRVHGAPQKLTPCDVVNGPVP